MIYQRLNAPTIAAAMFCLVFTINGQADKCAPVLAALLTCYLFEFFVSTRKKQ